MVVKLFARMNIISRIYLLIFGAALGVAAVVVMSAGSIEDTLMQERSEQTRRLVETVSSMAADYQARGKAGEFSDEEARQMALKAIINIRYDSNQYFWVNDMNGKMLMHPTQPKLNGANVIDLRDAKGVRFFADMIDTVKKNGSGSYRYYWPPDASKAQLKISYVKGIPDWGWVIGSGVFVDDVAKEVWDINKKLGIAAGVVLIVVLVFAAVIARSISGPIRRIVSGLADSADKVASAAGLLSSSSRELADGASAQAASIEETSASIEEMSSMTRHNAQNAGQADRIMRETASVVSAASDSMTRLTSSMDEITKASEETSKIVKTIDEIAFQTNLLALNAAVEAARAGEAGAGFAVVADEVRNLAIRAAEAAKNTADMIEGTVKRVKDGSALVQKTNEEFARVSGSATRMRELVTDVSAASQEQAQGIEQVNKAVSEMDRVVQRNASTAEESASASEELTAQAGQMKEFVASLGAIVGGSEKAGRPGAVVHPNAADKGRGLTGVSPSPAGKAPSPSVKAAGRLKIAGPRRAVREVRPERVIPFDDGKFEDF